MWVRDLCSHEYDDTEARFSFNIWKELQSMKLFPTSLRLRRIGRDVEYVSIWHVIEVTVTWHSASSSIHIFLIRIVRGGVQTGSIRHVGHWMAYFTCPGWLWWWRIWWNENWQGKPKYSEKIYPSATWPDPGLNPGIRGGKPATNCLSYGAVFNALTSAFPF
jgi:hypothetical protein